MERNQRRQNSPGREHRPKASRRPYSDEQETYRNPRNEYPDDERGDSLKSSQYSSRDPNDRGYGGAEGGYGFGDDSSEGDFRERYEPRHGARHGHSRNTWQEPDEGNFSDSRTRWPRDEENRSESHSQNWPHSRTGGSGAPSQHPGQPQGGRQFGAYSGTQTDERHFGEDHFGEDHSGRGPKNYSRSDERIKEDICDELSAAADCNAEDIEIEVKDGVVTLSGSVPSRKMKHRAEDIADDARGVKDVENRIRVTGRVRGSRQDSPARRDDGDDIPTNGRGRKGETQGRSRSTKSN